MEIRRLRSEIVAKIKSSSTMSSVTQCVTELVLNSLDAKCTAVAVRVNLVTFRVQVVDNGEGIAREDLESAGLRHMTSKCDSLEQLEKQVKCHGFRGETLASIIGVSESVEVTSKHISSSETYSKLFNDRAGNVRLVKDRPSCGTTVTVEGFLHNLPIRRKRVVPELELEDIKKSVECLVLIHPEVSFSVRNDVTGALILNSKKNKNILSSFRYIHPTVKDEFSLMRVSKGKMTIEALLCKGLFESRHLQYLYVNKRPVHCPKIQKFICRRFYKSHSFRKKGALNYVEGNKVKYPAYMVNIKCPRSNVDILLNATKTVVEFTNWGVVLRCLEKLMNSFLGVDKSTPKNKYLTPVRGFKSDCGVSQICGAQKAFGYKRGKSDTEKVIPEKVHRASPASSASEIEETQLPSSKKKVEGDSNDILVSVEGKIDGENKQQLTPKEHRRTVDAEEEKNDFTLSLAKENRKFKKPLPITVSHKDKPSGLPNRKIYQYPNTNISPYNPPKLITANRENSDTKNVPPSLPLLSDDRNSLFSKFTDDEDKGKNLIMDMFLKSTQVFNSEEDVLSNPRSEETVFEVESNFLAENNIQTRVNGLSKTMSVSVNVKSMKKIRKPKARGKSSKCVQTSVRNERMVSRSIQATADQKDPELAGFNFKNGGCNCNCHTGSGKLFNFKNLEEPKPPSYLLGGTVDLSATGSNLQLSLLNRALNLSEAESDLVENNVSPIEGIDNFERRWHEDTKRSKCKVNGNFQYENAFEYEKSPYFQSKQKYPHKKFDTAPQTIINERDLKFQRVFPPNPKNCLPTNETVGKPEEPSELFITLSNRQQRNILEKELVAEKAISERQFLDWKSQEVPEDKHEEFHELENEWTIKVNNLGSNFYVNKRTGFTTFFTPKPNSNQFKLDARFDFIPKGLSPILNDIKPVDKSLSQNKKDLLQDYILESHQDDLLTVKWKNYMKNSGKYPKAFFEEIYKEKVKQFECPIPSISTHSGKKYGAELNGVVSFDKSLFNNITVIGQLDKKFIVAFERLKKLIILFDQHAVHERVRLEELSKAYGNSRTECEDKFILFVPRNDLALLKRHETYLNSLGLSVEFFENGITISEIPSCLYHKFKVTDAEDSLNRAVQLLVNEIIEMLRTTRGVSFKSTPQILQNVVNLEACR
ncbi:hypothetical protein NQ318_010037, partial [Aromia moschata]